MTPAEIRTLVALSLDKLNAQTRGWVDQHLVEPREINVLSNEDRVTQLVVWLVTDHTGEKDSQYRIVYDPPNGSFGLEMTSDDGTAWYMGPYAPDFADVLHML